MALADVIGRLEFIGIIEEINLNDRLTNIRKIGLLLEEKVILLFSCQML